MDNFVLSLKNIRIYKVPTIVAPKGKMMSIPMTVKIYIFSLT